MSTPSNSGQYKKAGGLIVALGATQVTQTGLVVGRTYEFAVSDANNVAAVGRFGANAAASDGNFDFCVPSGTTKRVVATATSVSLIEAEAGASATAQVLISEVEG